MDTHWTNDAFLEDEEGEVEGEGPHVGLKLKTILDQEKEKLRNLEEQHMRALFTRENEQVTLTELDKKANRNRLIRGFIRTGAAVIGSLSIGMFVYMRHV